VRISASTRWKGYDIIHAFTSRYCVTEQKVGNQVRIFHSGLAGTYLEVCRLNGAARSGELQDSARLRELDSRSDTSTLESIPVVRTEAGTACSVTTGELGSRPSLLLSIPGLERCCGQGTGGLRLGGDSVAVFAGTRG
jgi:hypothetical protein